MTVDSAELGEDVPITIVYDNGGTDPDDTDSDSTPDAVITITDNSDGTAIISAVSMTHDATGKFVYEWDTSADGIEAGTYIIEITAEFSGLTKISKDLIHLTE